MTSISVPERAATSTPLPDGIERLIYGDGTPPVATIIIPTLDGQRRGLLQKLLSDLHDQTLASFEVLLIIGDRRQGRAINRGARAAYAPIIFTMDDDTVVGTPKLLAALCRVLDQDPRIGIVGASTVLPPHCSWFQRVASRQIPRRLFPIVNEITDSDMVQHPCLATRRELFLELGGEDEELIRGLDPLLRHKYRDAGYRVAIAPHSYISHPLPESYRAVIRMYFRNGRGSAFARKFYPDRVYNLSDGHRRNEFPARVPFHRRLMSYPLRVLRSLVTLKLIKLSVEAAYAMGFLYESLRLAVGRR